MKHLFLFLAMVAASVSCEKEAQTREAASEGIIRLTIEPGGPESRAGTPGVSAQNHETAIRKVDILVFDEQGRLNLHHAAGTSVSDIQFSVSTGQKEIWAVINGPDLGSVLRLTNLKTMRTLLEDNVINGSGPGFIMTGSQSCTVTPAAEGNRCTVTVSRLAARVALTRLSVNLPSSYKNVRIDHVMLINVIANQNLSGTENPSIWYNKKGLAESGSVIDGSADREADCPDLTFWKAGTVVQNRSSLPLDTPWYFYGYANPTVLDSAGSDGPFHAEKTRLVVCAEIDGRTYYYPVTLPSFDRNTAYEVELTIEGLGTDRPDILPEKRSVSTTVAIRPWQPGSVLTENI